MHPHFTIFERMILRYVFGPVEENGTWRKRYNPKLYKLFNESEIITYIKVKRLDMLPLRGSEYRKIKKVFNTKPKGSRKLGRPRLRW
jgi:hypothetical protein